MRNWDWIAVKDFNMGVATNVHEQAKPIVEHGTKNPTQSAMAGTTFGTNNKKFEQFSICLQQTLNNL